MSVVGTAILPLIFPPVDRAFRARVRVVADLPFGLILGAAYMRHNKSVLDFGGPAWFVPAIGGFAQRTSLASGAAAECSALEGQRESPTAG